MTRTELLARRTTPTGRFRAEYILAHLEHAVVQAYGEPVRTAAQ